ncbi:MAG: DUF373 family protein [archaeon]|nr:DUF373 family protein [archaeon]
MTEILVLAIDRDNDFGFKGKVKTPAIGIEKVTNAVLALGIADPEDSDVNALLAAISIYRDLEKNGENAEIALICGNRKVGYESDLHLTEELNIVMKTTSPKRSILVDDGAEDELIYPIISSHIAIDSVRRVYVKQAPGIERSLYILKKAITDPQKKKRFLTPLGVIMVISAFIYICANSCSFTKDVGEIVSVVTAFTIFIIGLTIILYSNDILGTITKYIGKWKERIKINKILFVFASFLLTIAIVGTLTIVNSFRDLARYGLVFTSLVILSRTLWILSFTIVLFSFWKFLNECVVKKRENFNYITRTSLILILVFLAQNLIDLIDSIESTVFTMLSAIGMTTILIIELIIFSSMKREVNEI